MLPHGLHSQFHRAAIIPAGELLRRQTHGADGQARLRGTIGYDFPDHDLTGKLFAPGLLADRGRGNLNVGIFVQVHFIL
jgi:hypothetical protein